MEIELHLVDAQAAPSMRNEQVLDAITELAVEAELGRFNLEVNVPPGPLSGAGLAELERQVRATLNAHGQAAPYDPRLQADDEEEITGRYDEGRPADGERRGPADKGVHRANSDGGTWAWSDRP